MAKWFCSPGALPVVIADELVVLIGGEGAEAKARAVTELRIGGAVEIADVIDVMLADGLSKAPDFFAGQLVGKQFTAVLKGAFLVDVDAAGPGRGLLDGRSKRTLTDIAVDRVKSIAVWQADDERVAADRPLIAGVFSAGQLFCDGSIPSEVRAPAATAAPAAPVAAAAPVPAAAPQPAVVAAEPVSNATVNYDTQAAAMAAPTAAPVQSAAMPKGAGYDGLFGNTTAAGLEDAAVRTEPAEETDASPAEFDETSSAVSAALCPQGHANPPERAQCWQCGQSLSQAKVRRVMRPGLGTLFINDGREVPLAGTVLVGRNPRAERTDSDHIPTLVAVKSDNHDISRTHLRIALEGWQVLLEDLGSTNGTVLREPSGNAQRLRSGQTVIVSDGSTVELGDGVVLTFRGVP